MVVRWISAVVAFAVVAYLGIAVIGNFSAEAAGNSWALTAALGLAAAFVAYAALEYAQTGGLASIARQFDTRTIVLMPIAIAINAETTADMRDKGAPLGFSVLPPRIIKPNGFFVAKKSPHPHAALLFTD